MMDAKTSRRVSPKIFFCGILPLALLMMTLPPNVAQAGDPHLSIIPYKHLGQPNRNGFRVAGVGGTSIFNESVKAYDDITAEQIRAGLAAIGTPFRPDGITRVPSDKIDAFLKAAGIKSPTGAPLTSEDIRVPGLSPKEFYEKHPKLDPRDPKNILRMLVQPIAETMNVVGNAFLKIVTFLLTLVRWFLLLIIALAGKFIDFILSANLTAAAAPNSGSNLVLFWKFTRDTLNFVFILSLLAIAFSVIAGLEGYGMRRMLPKLLFAALLVNFSLAFGAGIVRLGDVLCTTALRGLGQGSAAQCGGGQNSTKNAGKTLTVQLAGGASLGEITGIEVTNLLKLIGLGEKFTGGPPGREVPLARDFTENLGLFVVDLAQLAVIAIFVAAFIALAGMLFVRLIALYLLLVLAPVPFAFSLIPQAATYAQQWWTTFIRYVVFLPATVFFLVIAARLMGGSGTNSSIFGELDLNPSLLAGGIAANQGVQLAVQGLFQALFMAVFIFVALAMGSKLSIYGASGILAFAKGAALTLSGASPLWARTGKPLIAGYQAARKEQETRRGYGPIARLGALVAAPFGRTGAEVRAGMRRKTEEEEIKHYETGGIGLNQTVEDIKKGSVSAVRYAVKSKLHEEMEVKDLLSALQTLAKAGRTTASEFYALTNRVKEKAPAEGTRVVSELTGKSKQPGFDLSAEVQKAFGKLDEGKSYGAYKTDPELRTMIGGGLVQPTRNLARGIANAGDDLAAKAIVASGVKANPAAEKELKDRGMI